MVLILLPLVPLFITFLHGDLKLKNRLCTCISKSNYLPSDTTFSFPLRSSSVFCFSLKRQFNLDARAKFCISSSWTAMQYRVSRACFPKAFIKNSLWAVFLMCPLSNIKALFSAARSVMLCTLLHASRRWIILADAIFSAACNEPIIQRERSLHSTMATSHGPAWQVICLTKVIQEGHPPLGPWRHNSNITTVYFFSPLFSL